MVKPFRLDIGQVIQSERAVLYRILRELGHGGNAATYLAVARSGLHSGVPFAIKLFRNVSKPLRRSSFFYETTFLQYCDHPCIMKVLDRGIFQSQENWYPYLVAEYLPNTLDTLIRSGVLLVEEKISFAMQLLSALVYLHAQEPKVIHRDIKPKNIFVKGKSCVLGDLGLMKRVNDSFLDDRESLKESPDAGMPRLYRTPDQVAYLRGEQALTTKSDVFQLGLVLAELFTGVNCQEPSKRFTDSVQLAPLKQFAGPLSEAILGVLKQMLEMNASSRKDARWFLEPWHGIYETALNYAHAES